MDKGEKKVGSDMGGGGIGISGSLTTSSMRKVLEFLCKKLGLGTSSVFMDAGCALGRPLVHAMAHARVAKCVGVELDPVKAENALVFWRTVCELLVALHGREGDVEVLHCSMAQVGAVQPGVTHVFTFWKGWAVADKADLARFFMSQTGRKAIVVVQPKNESKYIELEMELYGFRGLDLVHTEDCEMHGSGRKMTAFIFEVVSWEQTGPGDLDDLDEEGKPSWWHRRIAEVTRDFSRRAHDAALGAKLAAGEPLPKKATTLDRKRAEFAHVSPEVKQAAARSLMYEPVPYVPGFEISWQGGLREIDSRHPVPVTFSTSDGHVYVKVPALAGPSKQRTLPLRNLVAAAHLPGAKDALQLDNKHCVVRGVGPRVVHRNGIKTDNSAANLDLQWPNKKEEHDEGEDAEARGVGGQAKDEGGADAAAAAVAAAAVAAGAAAVQLDHATTTTTTTTTTPKTVVVAQAKRGRSPSPAAPVAASTDEDGSGIGATHRRRRSVRLRPGPAM